MIFRVKPLIYEGVNIPKGSENDGTVPWGTQKMNKNGAVVSMGKMMKPKWSNFAGGWIVIVCPEPLGESLQKKALGDFEQFEWGG